MDAPATGAGSGTTGCNEAGAIAAAQGEAGVRNDAFVYSPRGTVERQDYVKQYAPLVRRLAHQMVARLPANVELDDMIQAGMMGLMDAVGRYEEAQGTQFEHYAASRIRGAMLDELRANDWLPRSARKSQRDIENAIHRLEGKFKRAPTEAEIAKEIGISIAEYQEMLNEARGAQLVYFDDLGGGGSEDEDYLERHVADTSEGGGDPGAFLRDKRFRSALVAAIEELPEREKLLMGMYYEQDMNLREIGAVMGVTESRVCQLHSQAVARLRSKLKHW
jgi:RNA polymerase sigma factor for flagellar operon FliA